MIETIESIQRQFEALRAKLDPASTEPLRNKAYAQQLGDCVAKTYILLNNGMCEELTMCRTCAQQRDYLRNMMELFETVGETGEVTPEVETNYFNFVERLGEINANIELVLAELKRMA